MWYENLSLVENIFSVFAMVVVAVLCWYKGNLGQAKKIALSLVIEAEDKFGNGTGALKYDYVLGYVYSRLPMIIRTFVSEATLEVIIEDAVDEMKQVLSSPDNTTPADNTDVSPIVAPADDQATVTPVVTPVVQPVVTPVVTPVVDPVVVPDTQPVVTPVVDPVVTPVVDNTTPADSAVVAPVDNTVVTPIDNTTGATESDTQVSAAKPVSSDDIKSILTQMQVQQASMIQLISKIV